MLMSVLDSLRQHACSARIPLSPLIEGIRSSKGLPERDADSLAPALDALLADGPLDYQRRREALRPISRIPTNLRRGLPNWVIEEGVSSELVLGWIWTWFTCGPMRSSPWPNRPDRDIYAFDLRLDPETRLALVEAGQQLLADTDLRTIPTLTATLDAVTRSYG